MCYSPKSFKNEISAANHEIDECIRFESAQRCGGSLALVWCDLLVYEATKGNGMDEQVVARMMLWWSRQRVAEEKWAASDAGKYCLIVFTSLNFF